jgi:hypothetical protein
VATDANGRAAAGRWTAFLPGLRSFFTCHE